MIRTKDGDLSLDSQGIVYRAFALHSPPRVDHWPWTRVRRVAIEDGGRRADRENLAFGLVGLLFRQARTLIVVSLDDEDVTFETKQPLAQVRAAARRLLDDVQEAHGKVLI